MPKYLDYDGTAYLVDRIDDTYVRKVAGKDLSSNDFTDEYKQKINELEAGAGNEAITSEEIDDIFGL